MSEALRFDIFAKDEFSKSFDKLLGKLPSVKKLALGAAAGISAIGVSLFAMAKTTATAYDKIGKFADQTGLTTEFLSKMAVAAEFSDVNINTMNKSLERLQIGIGEAGKGIGLAKDTLDEMGISLHQANGKMHTAETILPLLADKFQGMTDATMRSEAAQKLFGQRGIEMLKILKDGSEGLREYADEAEAMGLIVGPQAAANAAEFNDALFRLKGSLTGLKNAIGEKLIPILTKLANNISDFAREGQEDVIGFGKTFVKTMGTIVKSGVENAGKIIDAWSGLQGVWAWIEVKGAQLAQFLDTLGAKESAQDKQRKEERFKYIQILRESIKKLEQQMVDDYSIAGAARLGIERNFLEKEEAAYRESNDRKLALQEQYADALTNFNETLESGMQAKSDREALFAKIEAALIASLSDLKTEARDKEVEGEGEKNEILREQHDAHIDAWNEAEARRIKQEKEDDKKMISDRKSTFGIISTIGKTFGKEFFRISQAAGIAHAWMNTGEAVTKAMASAPPPYNFVLAGLVYAASAAQIARIASQKYAHGGLTNVPKEQTLTVTRGERILSPNQNKDFTNFIAGRGNGGGGVVIENIHILENATNAEMLVDMNESDWDEIVETNILPSLKRLNDRGFAIA